MPRAIVLIASVLAVGCDRDSQSVREDQARERRELEREHRQERRELSREQAEERREAREDEAPLPASTIPAPLTAALLQHQAATQLAVVACQGIATERIDACPIDGEQVTAVDDFDGGVRLRVSPQLPLELDDLQRTVGCYRARVEGRAASGRLASLPEASGPTPAAPPSPAQADPVPCAIDMTGIRVDVTRPAEQIEIRISTDAAQLPELRRRVHDLVGDRRSAAR